jgi:hypothetical protein
MILGHGLGHLLSFYGISRADIRTNTATGANDIIDLGGLFVFVPEQTRATQDPGAKTIAAAIFTKTAHLIYLHLKIFFSLPFR